MESNGTVTINGKTTRISGTLADIVAALVEDPKGPEVYGRRCFTLRLHVSPAEVEIMQEWKLGFRKRNNLTAATASR